MCVASNVLLSVLPVLLTGLPLTKFFSRVSLSSLLVVFVDWGAAVMFLTTGVYGLFDTESLSFSLLCLTSVSFSTWCLSFSTRQFSTNTLPSLCFLMVFCSLFLPDLLISFSLLFTSSSIVALFLWNFPL